jgi:hypothetical protein
MVDLSDRAGVPGFVTCPRRSLTWFGLAAGGVPSVPSPIAHATPPRGSSIPALRVSPRAKGPACHGSSTTDPYLGPHRGHLGQRHHPHLRSHPRRAFLQRSRFLRPRPHVRDHGTLRCQPPSVRGGSAWMLSRARRPDLRLTLLVSRRRPARREPALWAVLPCRDGCVVCDGMRRGTPFLSNLWPSAWEGRPPRR